jgi:hypothetical protein
VAGKSLKQTGIQNKPSVGSSYVEWLLLVESAQQDLGLQQREPH